MNGLLSVHIHYSRILCSICNANGDAYRVLVLAQCNWRLLGSWILLRARAFLFCRCSTNECSSETELCPRKALRCHPTPTFANKQLSNSHKTFDCYQRFCFTFLLMFDLSKGGIQEYNNRWINKIHVHVGPCVQYLQMKHAVGLLSLHKALPLLKHLSLIEAGK